MTSDEDHQRKGDLLLQQATQAATATERARLIAEARRCYRSAGVQGAVLDTDDEAAAPMTRGEKLSQQASASTQDQVR